MIYRIHHDDNYLMYVVPPVESMRKLGEQHGVFAFNSEPKPYASVWTPLQIEFHACEGKKPKPCRMYLSISAGYSCLKGLAKH